MINPENSSFYASNIAYLSEIQNSHFFGKFDFAQTCQVLTIFYVFHALANGEDAKTYLINHSAFKFDHIQNSQKS
jgi:hypothetical protein